MSIDTLSPEVAAKLEQIAKKRLGIDTLERRKSDRLDFHDLAVSDIKAALEAAYEAGRSEAGQGAS